MVGYEWSLSAVSCGIYTECRAGCRDDVYWLAAYGGMLLLRVPDQWYAVTGLMIIKIILTQYETIDDDKYGWDYDAGEDGIDGGSACLVCSPIAMFHVNLFINGPWD